MSCGGNDNLYIPPVQNEITTLNVAMQQDDMQQPQNLLMNAEPQNLQQNQLKVGQDLNKDAKQLEAENLEKLLDEYDIVPVVSELKEQLNAQHMRRNNAEAVEKLSAEERALLRPGVVESKPVLMPPLGLSDIKVTLSNREFKKREKVLREMHNLADIDHTYVETGAVPLVKTFQTTVKKLPSAMLANKSDLSSEEQKTWDGLENRYYNTLADNKTKDPDADMPGTAYVNAAMKMDSWLKGDEAKELMSPDAAVRHQVLDKLVTKALDYQLDEKMFTAKSFKKNGGQIVEMALFYPGLLDLVQQESQRSGYTAQDKEHILTTRNDTVQTLYSGFEQYVQIKGVKLGNVNEGDSNVQNAHFGDHQRAMVKELDEAAGDMDPTRLNKKRFNSIAQGRDKLSDIQEQYGQNLQECREEELDYRYQKQNPTQEVVKKAVEPQQVEKVTEKVDALLKEREYESSLGARIAEYTQVEQEERREVVESDKQLNVTHRLNVAQFDKKMASPPSAKELKEQEKQRKKALRNKDSGMGVTHRTAQLQEALEKGSKSSNISRYHTYYEEQRKFLQEKEAERAEKQERKKDVGKITFITSTAKKDKNLGRKWYWQKRKPRAEEEAKRKIKIPEYVSPLTFGVDRWMSEGDRFKFTKLSPEDAAQCRKAQKMITSVVSNATSLKLNEASFSAAFFTSNAQKIVELERGLPAMMKLIKVYGMNGGELHEKLKSYTNKFEHFNVGFKAFLANNGVTTTLVSAFPQRQFANTAEYREQYRSTVQANTDTMKESYDEYIKALRNNA